MGEKISKSKIKNIDYLFNRIISERLRDSMEAKYSLLMGAGCSISSDIVSAKDIINMLQAIAYIREQPTEDTNTPFLDMKYGDMVSFLQNWLNRNRTSEAFQAYVKNEEEKIENIIEKTKRKNDGYYEEVFYSIIREKYSDYNLQDKKEKKKIIEKLLGKYKKDIVKDMEYSYWFTKYSCASEDIHGFLAELMNNKQPSEAYILLADLFVNKMFSTAFTTNFDNLLAEALSLLGIRSKELWFDSNEVDNTLSKTSPNIVKLHGDYMYNNTKNLSTETRKLSDTLQYQLESVLSKGGLIVVGYAGTDNSIMYLLERLSDRYSFPLFWCELSGKIDDNSIHWRVKRLIEKSDSAYFVKIDSFDQLVKSLREKYMIYTKLRRSKIDSIESANKEILYDDKYLTEALSRIQKMIDSVLVENKRLSNRVAVKPEPPIDLFK